MASDNGDRALGNLEGRVEEQSALVHQLHADITTGFQQVNSRIDQTNADMRAELQQVNSRIDQTNADMAAGFQQVNNRIDKLVIAVLAIGGGVLAALIGIIATLLVMMAQGG